MSNYIMDLRKLVDEMKLFNIYSGSSQHYTYPNGDEAYFINIIFLCSNFHGNLKIDKNESKEIMFFDINKLPTEITSSNKIILEDIKRAWESI